MNSLDASRTLGSQFPLLPSRSAVSFPGINLQIRFWSNKSRKEAVEKREKRKSVKSGTAIWRPGRRRTRLAVGDKNAAVINSPLFLAFAVAAWQLSLTRFTFRTSGRARKTKAPDKGVRRGHVCHQVVNTGLAHIHTRFLRHRFPGVLFPLLSLPALSLITLPSLN